MDNDEIAAELRKRAEEMRALPEGVWAARTPLPGQECAVVRCESNGWPEPTMSNATHRTANRWVAAHGLAPGLSMYNDRAFDQFEVANMLDKIAEDISC